jgi:hypothetical protein
VTKDAFGDHGLVTSEEVFAFSASQTGPAAKSAPIVDARPLAVQVARQETLPARLSQVAASETGPVAKVMQPRKKLFSTAASRTPPRAPPAEETQQVPATAATTSIQPRAPEAANPVSVAAPVISDAAPVPAATPAPAMEVIPPKMIELTDRVLLESPRPPDVPRPTSRARPWKKAAELAAVIEQDLAQHPDAPRQGLRVTVYGGGTDWRAMLTFMPAAGPVRNAQQLRELTDHLAEGLRQRYSLAWD